MYGYSFLLAICGDIRSNHYWSLNMCESPWEEELLIVIVFLLSYSCTLIFLVSSGLLFSQLIFPFGVFSIFIIFLKTPFPPQSNWRPCCVSKNGNLWHIVCFVESFTLLEKLTRLQYKEYLFSEFFLLLLLFPFYYRVWCLNSSIFESNFC